MTSFAMINIAKKQLGIEEDDYRTMLRRVTGKASLRAMSGAEKKAVVAELKRLGFVPTTKGNWKHPTATKKYQRLMHALWRSCHALGVIDDGSRRALRAFCGKTLGGVAVTDPDLLSYEQAKPVIDALRAMERRGKAS